MVVKLPSISKKQGVYFLARVSGRVSLRLRAQFSTVQIIYLSGIAWVDHNCDSSWRGIDLLKILPSDTCVSRHHR